MTKKEDREQRVQTIKSEVVSRLTKISSLKADKSTTNKSYTAKIKTLQDENDKLLEELDELQRADLTDEADKILAEDDGEHNDAG